MLFLTVIGARPQFVKASPLSRVLRQYHREILVHTGQHYDHGMSDVFFRELDIPAPDYHLGIGSGAHGAQTGQMLEGLERIMQEIRPDVVVVYGDTNSTLAGALSAAKLRIPVAHVEAGLRSFNRAMPEEVNRVLTDHVSEFLFAPSELSRAQLEREGITQGVHVVGDIMLDVILGARERARQSVYPGSLGLVAESYYLATVHRAENTDDACRLAGILAALDTLDRPVVLPLHPRTRARLTSAGLKPGTNIRVLDPVGYLDMVQLESNAACILTDSGGVQKEAYYLGVPCVTLREETEWMETVDAGWNVLAGTETSRIRAAVRQVTAGGLPRPDLYGFGDAAHRIVRTFAT